MLSQKYDFSFKLLRVCHSAFKTFALQLTQDQNTLLADQVKEDEVSFPNLKGRRAALQKQVIFSLMLWLRIKSRGPVPRL